MNTNNLQDDYLTPIINAVINLDKFAIVTDSPFEDAEKEDYPAFVIDEISDRVTATDEAGVLNYIDRRGRMYILESLSPETRLPYEKFKVDVDEDLELEKFKQANYEISELAKARRTVDNLAKEVIPAIVQAVNFVIILEQRNYRHFQIGNREVFACELVLLNKFSENIL